jgi:hypothetical protein
MNLESPPRQPWMHGRAVKNSLTTSPGCMGEQLRIA